MRQKDLPDISLEEDEFLRIRKGFIDQEGWIEAHDQPKEYSPASVEANDRKDDEGDNESYVRHEHGRTIIH